MDFEFTVKKEAFREEMCGLGRPSAAYNKRNTEYYASKNCNQNI